VVFSVQSFDSPGNCSKHCVGGVLDRKAAKITCWLISKFGITCCDWASRYPPILPLGMTSIDSVESKFDLVL
jgi:hypothetical protein